MHFRLSGPRFVDLLLIHLNTEKLANIKIANTGILKIYGAAAHWPCYGKRIIDDLWRETDTT